MIYSKVDPSLAVVDLQRAYRAGELRPSEVIQLIYDRVSDCTDAAIWISRTPQDVLLEYARRLDEQLEREPNSLERLPLFGIPFAVKDNIDVAGMETTAACPQFAYKAARTAMVVERLQAAGAILVGKTNLDQFATGLVGLRSPYGAPKNAFNADYLPGGSSSGSAVAVAHGLVSFALGTDTAGSGRVPAALNNVVGFKPTRGLFSNRGVVPACASLDCVSIFSLSVGDAVAVANILAAYDPEDPFSRSSANTHRFGACARPGPFRFAVPQASQLKFFGDNESAERFAAARQRLIQLGGQELEIDFSPFQDAASLLYDGPWVAERWQTIGPILSHVPEAVDPQVGAAVERGPRYAAVDVFRAEYRRRRLLAQTYAAMQDVDCLMVPTIGRPYRVSEARVDPHGVNRNLGYYTNFVNLLDLCAIAVPAGTHSSGVPLGVTLIGLPLSENRLCALADGIHRLLLEELGLDVATLPALQAPPMPNGGNHIMVCVSGAHMSGLPLNHQLTSRHACLLRKAKTAPVYRLYALEQFDPPRPGMVRGEHGSSIDVEVWAVPGDQFGSFVANIPAPLGIGKVKLEDNTDVCGFVCESAAITSSVRDITHFGGWRQYLAQRSA